MRDREREGIAIVASASAVIAVARLRRMEPSLAGQRLTAVLARNAQPAEMSEARDAEASWTASRACGGCGMTIWTTDGELRADLCGECRREEASNAT